MLVPHAGGYAPSPGISSFQPVAHYYTSTAAATPSTPAPVTRTPFRAPAHKHAHHLHSIPPREKSTRTLIIDHMLWVHGRTRFAQARAELGMTDRTGGPSSPNYTHRRRPENYEEEAEENSEGEDAIKLKARTGDPSNPHENDEDARMKLQDLSLARTLRLRAEGLEKVVTSMLVQTPPTVHPLDDDDPWSPPDSPPLHPSNQTNRHQHTLPNGVRLRLALGTIINDLFARQAPPPSYRHQLQAKSPSVELSPSDSLSNHNINNLPVALSSIYTVSAAFSYPTSSPITTGPSLSNYTPPSSYRQLPTPTPRVRSFYNAGADPDTANSPPSLRCSRHLHTGCEICVEAKTPAPGTQSRGRSTSFGDYRSTQNNAWKGMPGGVGPGGGGITGWQDGSGIGSGLLRSGVRGSSLRRKPSETGPDETGSGAGAGPSGSGSGNTKLSELIPRFIRLSALVAVELAIEAKDALEQEQEAAENSSPAISREDVPDQFDVTVSDQEWAQMQRQRQARLSPHLPMSPTISRAAVQSQDNASDVALRPTREWYLLLGGLLTRAVLEGYLTAGWRGSQAVECLMTVGLGIGDYPPLDNEEPDEFAEFDPDDLPNLYEAMKLLFPTQSSQSKSQAEEEFGLEMRERLRRFYDIPASTPDLSTHMEDLAWQYPAEPVERAAVRFCEAVARWRGKPELETYKKPTQISHDSPSQTIPGGPSSLSIDSLVHSNPPTPILPHTRNASSRPRRPRRKPSIESYFSQPSSSFQDTSWNPNKRRRSPEVTRPSPSKRPNLG